MISKFIKKNKWNIILLFITVIGIGLCEFLNKILLEKYQFFICLSRDLLLYSYLCYITIQLIGKICDIARDINKMDKDEKKKKHQS